MIGCEVWSQYKCIHMSSGTNSRVWGRVNMLLFKVHLYQHGKSACLNQWYSREISFRCTMVFCEVFGDFDVRHQKPPLHESIALGFVAPVLWVVHGFG